MLLGLRGDEEDNYESIIPEDCRWKNWAAPNENGQALTGEKLLSFVNNVLFPVLKGQDVFDGDKVLYKGITVSQDTPIRKAIVKTTFEDANNYMKDGACLREVIDVVDRIDFSDVKESHDFGTIYEEILRGLQSAGSAGEFYTPRAVTDFMAKMISPQLGENMADFACGTGGFITSWLSEVNKHIAGKDDIKTIGSSFFGVEKKQFPYLLCITNMLLHDVEFPNIIHGNSLTHNLLDYTEDDKFSIILMNPPYGGSENKSVRHYFPDDLATSETADLFMSVIMYRLKKHGRAAVVVPDGFLTGTIPNDYSKYNIKRKLLTEFNLHTVIRIPPSVFSPYTPIATNILFFDNEGTTKTTWFYRVDMPSDRKHFSKTKPMELKHFESCMEWWKNRKKTYIDDNPQSEEYDVDFLLNERQCNLDLCGYPVKEELILSPMEVINNFQRERSELNSKIDTILETIEALLPEEG